ARLAVAERACDLVGPVVGDQAARGATEAAGLARPSTEAVAARCLMLTPDPRRDGRAPALVVALGVLLALTHRVGQVNVTDEAPVRGARIELLVRAVHAPAGPLDPFPYLKAAARARQAAQIGDNDSRVITTLDPPARGLQRRTLGDRAAATDAHLGRHELDPRPDRRGVTVDLVHLFFVGVQRIAAAGSDVTHSDDSGPELAHLGPEHIVQRGLVALRLHSQRR